MDSQTTANISICERDFGRDAQRVYLRILMVSEESLGRDETPRLSSHELISHKYSTISFIVILIIITIITMITIITIITTITIKTTTILSNTAIKRCLKSY